ncbi:MAG: hypothetical protein J6B87_03640 [Clostridia bacterium]|nr:hypothetical protein [Clostridia bacterium]
MMKNKGVSMIELVIVIILLIMIAAFAIFSTKTTNLQAEATLLYTEMKALKEGILAVQQDYNYGIIDEIKEGKHYNTTSGDWCVIYGINEPEYSPTIIENVNVDELKRTYLVKFETGEVKLEEPATIGEYKIETYENIETVMESGAI